MGLSISTMPARLSYNCIPGKIEMQSSLSKLELKQMHGKISMESELPKVLIDQYDCFAEEGLKNNLDLSKEQTRSAYENVMAYISRVAQDGDAMAEIGKKANIMIDIAARNSVTTHEFGMATMPMSSPHFDMAGGTLKIEAEPRGINGDINGVIGTYIPGELRFSYTPSKLDIKVESYGSVEIKYTGNNIDSYI